MRSALISLQNVHEHGGLLADLFRARKTVFIDRLGWQLPEIHGMEYDQYDTPAAQYVIVHDEDSKVLGGMRLTPTTMRSGIYSYMIRDAQRGLLETLPTELLFEEAPVTPRVWEGTRAFVADCVTGLDRARVERQIHKEIQKAGRAFGFDKVLVLTTVHWDRWAKALGLRMREIGPHIQLDTPNVVLEMDIASA